MARRIKLEWFATAAVLAAFALPAQAEEVDRLLYRQARKLYETIADKKAGTVAVLKFRAQKASEPGSSKAGRDLRRSRSSRISQSVVLGLR